MAIRNSSRNRTVTTNDLTWKHMGVGAAGYTSAQRERNREHDENVRTARRHGQAARQAGKPVWLNPFVGARARAWQNGWEEAGKAKTKTRGG